MNHKTDLDKYIVNVQGKDFITFPGLLAEAHAQGLQSIQTELVNSDMKNPVVKATVILAIEGKTKTFTGYGDANADNVAKKVVGALLRMAETRSIARTLRFACNIDMAALEELSSDDDVINHAKSNQPIAPKTGFNKPVQTSVTKTETSTTVVKTEVATPEPSLSQALNGLKKADPVGPTPTKEAAETSVAKPSFGRRTTLQKSPDPKF